MRVYLLLSIEHLTLPEDTAMHLALHLVSGGALGKSLLSLPKGNT